MARSRALAKLLGSIAEDLPYPLVIDGNSLYGIQPQVLLTGWSLVRIRPGEPNKSSTYQDNEILISAVGTA
jgi:hypothetical protein